MDVTIAICTYNRCDSLRQTMEWLARVRVPEGLRCRLMVVDNASTDGTAELLRSYELPNMSVHHVYEPRRGQCYARNTAVTSSNTGIILFTDDDVCPPPNWLEGMCAPIAAGKADAVVGGVKIAEHLERPWMKRLQRMWLASTDVYDAGKPLNMVGANMAFSREVLAKVPGFDTELGPGALGFEDETLFSRQLKEAGYHFVSAFETTVEHHFDQSRLLRTSFLDAARKKGRSQAYVWHHWQHRTISFPRRRLAGVLLRLAKWRAMRRRECSAVEGMPEWEMTLLTDLYFYKQYLIERKRPRNYDKHGLVKLNA